MKIAVIGAGITGMSFAKAIKQKHEVHLYEASAQAGGIARPLIVDGVSYHPVGGHCFNSKYPEVLDFVFSKVLPKESWHKVTRNAAIRFHGRDISYPIEFSVSEIAKFNEALAINIIRDFICTNEKDDYANLEEWFRGKFGNSLSEEYFLPYNRKIWDKDPSEMSYSWVEGKLPIPNKNAFIKSLLNKNLDNMPHSEFYYPKENSQIAFINALAEGLDIRLGNKVRHIEKLSNGMWVVNQLYEYDLIVNTAPLKELPSMLNYSPDIVKLAAKNLKYNKVSTMLWESEPTDKTWTYIPDRNSIFHRYIHIGNFFNPPTNHTITESVGVKNYTEMVEEGKKDPFLIRPMAHHISNHAYVVYDQHRDTAIKTINQFLENQKLYSIGRFGKWDYYNMDICILDALNLIKSLQL